MQQRGAFRMFASFISLSPCIRLWGFRVNNNRQVFKSGEEKQDSRREENQIWRRLVHTPSLSSHQLRCAKGPPWRVHWCLSFSPRAQDDCPALRDKSCYLCKWTTSGQSGQGRELLSKVHLQHSRLTGSPRPSWSKWLPWAPWSHRPSWKGW